MSQDDTLPIVDTAEVPPSALEFFAYCEAERDRLRNTGEPFDESLFNAAVDLALRKFQVLEERGAS
jgi:hypothetical protein